MRAVFKDPTSPRTSNRRRCFRWRVPLRGVLIRCNVFIVTNQKPERLLPWSDPLLFLSGRLLIGPLAKEPKAIPRHKCAVDLTSCRGLTRQKCQTTRLSPFGCGILWKDRSTLRRRDSCESDGKLGCYIPCLGKQCKVCVDKQSHTWRLCLGWTSRLTTRPDTQ